MIPKTPISGVGLIGPYVAMVLNPEIIKDIAFLESLQEYGLPQDKNSIIVFIMSLLADKKMRVRKIISLSLH